MFGWLCTFIIWSRGEVSVLVLNWKIFTRLKTGDGGYVCLTYDGRRKTVRHFNCSLWTTEVDRPDGGHLGEEEDHTWCQPASQATDCIRSARDIQPGPARLQYWQLGWRLCSTNRKVFILSAHCPSQSSHLQCVPSNRTLAHLQLQCNDVSVCLPTIFSLWFNKN